MKNCDYTLTSNAFNTGVQYYLSGKSKNDMPFTGLAECYDFLLGYNSAEQARFNKFLGEFQCK